MTDEKFENLDSTQECTYVRTRALNFLSRHVSDSVQGVADVGQLVGPVTQEIGDGEEDDIITQQAKQTNRNRKSSLSSSHHAHTRMQARPLVLEYVLE